MTVGVGMKGNEVTFLIGGAELQGELSNSFSLNNESLDTTDKSSEGWAEMLAKPGTKSAEFSVSGPLKNLELPAAYFGTNSGDQDSQIYPFTITWPDGSTLTGDAFHTSFSTSGDANTLITYDASWSISGKPTFTAGT